MRETRRVSTNLADLGIPDGLIAVVKQDCPACQLVVPVFEQLAEDPGLTVYSQDDPGFPSEADWVVDDTDLINEVAKRVTARLVKAMAKK